jgi:tetratricopeptide (TPR) repeat protein
MGQPANAIDAFTRARDLHHASGHRNFEARTWIGLGDALREASQMAKAIDAYTRARDIFQTTGDRHREAIAWTDIGIVLHEAGRTAESINAYRTALELRAEFDNWYETGRTLQNLAVAHQASGEEDHARTAWLQAADAFTRANAPAEARRLAGEEAQAPLTPPAPSVRTGESPPHTSSW